MLLFFFFFTATATTEIYTLSLHDALPIYPRGRVHHRRRLAVVAPGPHRRGGGCGDDHPGRGADPGTRHRRPVSRSEEHTSELQSHHDLVCRLLLEKKKKKI